MTDATSFSLRSIEYTPRLLTYPAQHHRNPLSGLGFEELSIAGEPGPFCGTLNLYKVQLDVLPAPEGEAGVMFVISSTTPSPSGTEPSLALLRMSNTNIPGLSLPPWIQLKSSLPIPAFSLLKAGGILSIPRPYIHSNCILRPAR
jgi:hypothetical protein